MIGLIYLDLLVIFAHFYNEISSAGDVTFISFCSHCDIDRERCQTKMTVIYLDTFCLLPIFFLFCVLLSHKQWELFDIFLSISFILSKLFMVLHS